MRFRSTGAETTERMLPDTIVHGRRIGVYLRCRLVPGLNASQPPGHSTRLVSLCKGNCTTALCWRCCSMPSSALAGRREQLGQPNCGACHSTPADTCDACNPNIFTHEKDSWKPLLRLPSDHTSPVFTRHALLPSNCDRPSIALPLLSHRLDPTHRCPLSASRSPTLHAPLLST